MGPISRPRQVPNSRIPASRARAKVHIAVIGPGPKPSLSFSSGESVAGTAHGLHQSLQLIRFERLTQPADVHVHCTLFDVSITAPNAVEQLAAGEHPLRVGHE